MKGIKAFAPATIANFNVGYDVLGLSLNNVGDQVEVSFNNSNQNRITEIINGNGLPTELEKNCCSVVIAKMQESLGDLKGIDIKITKGINARSGMGSSSASSAAAAFAFNKLMDTPFSKKELVFFAAEGERAACGSAHTDNVAPSVLGGIVLIKGKTIKDLIELPVPHNLFAVSFFPKIRINTADSRKILKDNVPLSVASQQVANMGGFVASLYENNLELFSNSLQDLMIEPMRSMLIPKFNALKKSVHENGGLAFGISGSGPSVFAITEGETNAKIVLNAMNSVYSDLNIEVQTYVNQLTKNSGARIIETNQ